MTDDLILCKGLKPKQEDKRDFLLSAQALPPVPNKPFGHGGTFKDWLMLANGPDPTAPGKAKSGVGCCVWSSAAHETMEALTDAGANPQQVASLFNGATTVADYSQFTGYDPSTGEGDNGTEIRDSLKQRQKTGIVDSAGKRHKIGLYFSVNFHNPQELAVALYYGEGLPCGVAATEESMEAFQRAEQDGSPCVWDKSEGQVDHCIPLVGRPGSAGAAPWAALTWGRRIYLTDAFLTGGNVGEVWSYVTPERISKVTNKEYEGPSEAVLEEYLQMAAKA
jgi:hypothetical protein